MKTNSEYVEENKNEKGVTEIITEIPPQDKKQSRLGTIFRGSEKIKIDPQTGSYISKRKRKKVFNKEIKESIVKSYCLYSAGCILNSVVAIITSIVIKIYDKNMIAGIGGVSLLFSLIVNITMSVSKEHKIKLLLILYFLSAVSSGISIAIVFDLLLSSPFLLILSYSVALQIGILFLSIFILYCPMKVSYFYGYGFLISAATSIISGIVFYYGQIFTILASLSMATAVFVFIYLILPVYIVRHFIIGFVDYGELNWVYLTTIVFGAFWHIIFEILRFMGRHYN